MPPKLADCFLDGSERSRFACSASLGSAPCLLFSFGQSDWHFCFFLATLFLAVLNVMGGEESALRGTRVFFGNSAMQGVRQLWPTEIPFVNDADATVCVKPSNRRANCANFVADALRNLLFFHRDFNQHRLR